MDSADNELDRVTTEVVITDVPTELTAAMRLHIPTGQCVVLVLPDGREVIVTAAGRCRWPIGMSGRDGPGQVTSGLTTGMLNNKFEADTK